MRRGSEAKGGRIPEEGELRRKGAASKRGKASQGEAGASCAYPVGRTARGEVPSTFPRGLGEGAGRLVELRLCPRGRLGDTRTSLRDGGGDR